MTKTETADSAEVLVGRLRTFVETFEAMSEDNERRAALYYLIARFYGNATGDRVLALLRDQE